MAIINSTQIQEYYERFGKIEVTFTREINQSLALAIHQVFLRFQGGQSSCVIFASSMQEAKVVVALTSTERARVNADKRAALRFSFHQPDSSDVFSFFIQSRVSQMTLYDKEKGLYFVHLTFTQRPPDHLIGKLGRLLEINANAAQRMEDRILISEKNIRKLGLSSKSVTVNIDRIPRNGILRDLSFAGMKVILMANARFLLNKTAEVVLPLANGNSLLVQGEILRYEPVEGRKDLAILAIQSNPEKVPYEYKEMIHDYLKHMDLAQSGRNAPGE